MMPAQPVSTEIRTACRAHARLLDAFIEMTRAEMDRHHSSFAEESLREMLEIMRNDRKKYGALAGLIPVENAA
jgi:hypothetical protein